MKISHIFAHKIKYGNIMRIIARSTLVKYCEQHPQAKHPLEDWYLKVRNAEWKSLADVRTMFNTVDYVGNDRYVFNIKGDDYRLIVVIRFVKGRIYIRFIGTHAEYDRITDIKNI